LKKTQENQNDPTPLAFQNAYQHADIYSPDTFNNRTMATPVTIYGYAVQGNIDKGFDTIIDQLVSQSKDNPELAVQIMLKEIRNQNGYMFDMHDSEILLTLLADRLVTDMKYNNSHK
jgi:hypothetical protein